MSNTSALPQGEWRITGDGFDDLAQLMQRHCAISAQQRDTNQPVNWGLNLSCVESRHLKDHIYLKLWMVECSADWSYTSATPSDDIVMSFPLEGRQSHTFADQTVEIGQGQAIMYQQREQIRQSFIAGDGVARSVSLRLSHKCVRRIIARRTGRFDRLRTDFRQVFEQSLPGFALIPALATTLSGLDSDAVFSVLSEETRHALITAMGELVFDLVPNVTRRHVRLSEADGVPPYVRKACDYVLHHYRDAITIRQLAEHCAVSLRKLERGFDQSLKTTPSAFVKKVRLEAIRAVLTSGGFRGTISALAAECGYSSRHRFLKDYTARFGETPRETLRAHKQ